MHVQKHLQLDRMRNCNYDVHKWLNIELTVVVELGWGWTNCCANVNSAVRNVPKRLRKTVIHFLSVVYTANNQNNVMLLLYYIILLYYIM